MQLKKQFFTNLSVLTLIGTQYNLLLTEESNHVDFQSKLRLVEQTYREVRESYLDHQQADNNFPLLKIDESGKNTLGYSHKNNAFCYDPLKLAESGLLHNKEALKAAFHHELCHKIQKERTEEYAAHEQKINQLNTLASWCSRASAALFFTCPAIITARAAAIFTTGNNIKEAFTRSWQKFPTRSMHTAYGLLSASLAAEWKKCALLHKNEFDADQYAAQKYPEGTVQMLQLLAQREQKKATESHFYAVRKYFGLNSYPAARKRISAVQSFLQNKNQQ